MLSEAKNNANYLNRNIKIEREELSLNLNHSLLKSLDLVSC